MDSEISEDDTTESDGVIADDLIDRERCGPLLVCFCR